MRRASFVGLFMFLVLCGGCGNDEESGADLSTVIIQTDRGTVLVKAEVADSPEERGTGLMHRKSLPDDGGMLFLFFEQTTSSFWMKDTLIPLSIAFFDQEGEILEILDMKPCRKDPCPLYGPGMPYWGALEVNQGAFERWGVEVGDLIRTNQ